jgi:hypothetical protein
MKKSLLIILFTLIATVGCKESTTEPPVDVTSSDYFPNSNGNYYYYNFSVYDSSGLIQSGIRKNYFVADTVLLLTPYQIKVDSFQIDNVNQSYFRKSSTGIFNYVGTDTTGFSGFIPDSLRGGISFDSEYRLLYQPLSLNQSWPVHKVTVDYMSYQFDFFTVDAAVISKDTLTITFQSGSETKSVYKIKYQAKLVIGISSDPITYDCYTWVAENIGFIRWEGDTELINFFAGANIYPANTTVIEELYSYKIQ